jgi:DNA-directed RNA polymerase subunit RPC12/RpoP
MYVCGKCQREYSEKPNGRCPNCGGLVKKVFDDGRGKGHRNDRKNFRNARKFKHGDWES